MKIDLQNHPDASRYIDTNDSVSLEDRVRNTVNGGFAPSFADSEVTEVPIAMTPPDLDTDDADDEFKMPDALPMTVMVRVAFPVAAEAKSDPASRGVLNRRAKLSPAGSDVRARSSAQARKASEKPAQSHIERYPAGSMRAAATRSTAMPASYATKAAELGTPGNFANAHVPPPAYGASANAAINRTQKSDAQTEGSAKDSRIGEARQTESLAPDGALAGASGNSHRDGADNNSSRAATDAPGDQSPTSAPLRDHDDPAVAVGATPPHASMPSDPVNAGVDRTVADHASTLKPGHPETGNGAGSNAGTAQSPDTTFRFKAWSGDASVSLRLNSEQGVATIIATPSDDNVRQILDTSRGADPTHLAMLRLSDRDEDANGKRQGKHQLPEDARDDEDLE